MLPILENLVLTCRLPVTVHSNDDAASSSVCEGDRSLQHLVSLLSCCCVDPWLELYPVMLSSPQYFFYHNAVPHNITAFDYEARCGSLGIGALLNIVDKVIPSHQRKIEPPRLGIKHNLNMFLCGT